MPTTYTSIGNGYILLQNKHFIEHVMPDLSALQLKIYLYLCTVSRDFTLQDLEAVFGCPKRDIKDALNGLYKLKLIDVQKKDNNISIFLGNSKSLYDNTDDKRELLKEVEEILTRPASTTEISVILYCMEDLGFSKELTLYLVSHCKHKGSVNPKYLEKVALCWAEKGISTVKEASMETILYKPYVYEDMKTLGYTDPPAPVEAEYFTKWHEEMNLSEQLITEACKRAVLAHAKSRITYADKILCEWKEKGIDSPDQIDRMDGINSDSNTKIHFELERQYDFNDIEKKLIKKQRTRTGSAGI